MSRKKQEAPRKAKRQYKNKYQSKNTPDPSLFAGRIMGKCPSCKDGMVVIKVNNTTLQLFLTCHNYEKCKSKAQPIPEHDMTRCRRALLDSFFAAWTQEYIEGLRATLSYESVKPYSRELDRNFLNAIGKGE